MPPCGLHSSAYRARLGLRVATSLVSRRSTVGRASGPATWISPMWERSKRPAAVRTAWCSSRMDEYCNGIAQPPKFVICAPSRWCSSRSGVRSTVATGWVTQLVYVRLVAIRLVENLQVRQQVLVMELARSPQHRPDDAHPLDIPRQQLGDLGVGRRPHRS